MNTLKAEPADSTAKPDWSGPMIDASKMSSGHRVARRALDNAYAWLESGIVTK